MEDPLASNPYPKAFSVLTSGFLTQMMRGTPTAPTFILAIKNVNPMSRRMQEIFLGAISRPYGSTVGSTLRRETVSISRSAVALPPSTRDPPVLTSASAHTTE